MHFSGAPSTHMGKGVVTYAQNLCCSAVGKRLQCFSRYQSHSASKLLIYIDFLKCFFYGQSGESLDLQGLQRYGGNLSTKLSTEKVGFFKALVNQALSALFACVSKEVPTISHQFELCA
jgi:hypothetical protein